MTASPTHTQPLLGIKQAAYDLLRNNRQSRKELLLQVGYQEDTGEFDALILQFNRLYDQAATKAIDVLKPYVSR